MTVFGWRSALVKERDRSTLKGDASRASAQRDNDVAVLGDLGLDVVGQVVGVVAREVLASGHEALIRGPHLLDVVLVQGVDDGRDVKVRLAISVEVDLAQHAGLVRLAIDDGVEVADPGVGEVDGGLLLVVDDDRGYVRGGAAIGLNVGSEVDGALLVVESHEGDGVGADGERGGDEGHGRGSEMHLEYFVVVLFEKDWIQI